MGWNIVKRNAGSLIDDVRRDIAITFMLTCHKLSFLIGQFEVEVKYIYLYLTRSSFKNATIGPLVGIAIK
jgi:hypothetical protein